MSDPLVTVDDIKEYLGKTGTDDDLLIESLASSASVMAERDTGRIFAVSSNVTHRYSTDGQASITILDRPYNDATRTVTLSGATMTEGTNVWFLQDRADPDATHTIQMRSYSTEWFSRSFNWFDANLDNPRFRSGLPNDLVIFGTVGHPETPPDVYLAVLELAAFLYWRAKGGASSFAETLTGTEVDLALLPMAYQIMVRNWKIHTAVVAV